MKIKYDYSLLRIDYPNRLPLSNDKVRVICNLHGEFSCSLTNHKRGNWLPKMWCYKTFEKTKIMDKRKLYQKCQNLLKQNRMENMFIISICNSKKE